MECMVRFRIVCFIFFFVVVGPERRDPVIVDRRPFSICNRLTKEKKIKGGMADILAKDDAVFWGWCFCVLDLA